MTKSESPKPPAKLQTITLKVYIHCEGCRRKVRRIIRVVDGVEDVTVDSANNKVTVTGTADVKTILERLQKYGKQAEVWPTSSPAPPTANKASGNQPKLNGSNDTDSSSKKKGNGGAEGGGKGATMPAENVTKKGDGKKALPGAAAKGQQDAAGNVSKPEKSKETNSEEADSGKAPTQNGGGSGGGGGKKGGKKGGNGGNGNNSSGEGIMSNASEVLSLGHPAPDHPMLSAPNASVVVSANRSHAPYDSIQTGYAYQSADYATHMFSDENANNCSIM